MAIAFCVYAIFVMALGSFAQGRDFVMGCLRIFSAAPARRWAWGARGFPQGGRAVCPDFPLRAIHGDPLEGTLDRA